MLFKVNPINPQNRLIQKAVDILIKGGIVVYPTDTHYGIGCDILNKKAIERIYQLKQRNKSKPFSFICSGLKNISHYAKVSNYAYKTMRRLLPGPYTFILEGSKLVPKIMLTNATTPDGSILNDASLIHDVFKNRIDLVIDGDIVPGKPSSVISLINDTPEVIRKGTGDVSIFQ
jgi:tRNA A37 threonylcarbamoyladenosine synthetase subunit TsaC/SUA5/YrdC